MARAFNISESAKRVLWLGVVAVIAMPAVFETRTADFLPFYAAARLARSNSSAAVYLPASASSLLDVDPRFRQVASVASQGGLVTAFVAPPAAIPLIMPFSAVSYRIASLIWRVVLGIIAVATLWVLDRRVRSNAPEVHLQWRIALLVFSPLLAYGMALGQNAILLLPAAAAFISMTQRRASLTLAVFLALTVLLKAFPATLILFLLMMRRWKEARIALALIAVGVFTALLVVPLHLWSDFVNASSALAARVIPDWNNVSVDALAARVLSRTATVEFFAPSAPVRAASAVLRIITVAVGLYIGTGRTGAGPEQRWAAGWVTAFSLSPLLWLFYLAAMPAMLLPALIRRSTPGVRANSRWAAILLLLAAGATMLTRIIGSEHALLVGDLGSTVWLMTSALILWDGWSPGPRSVMSPAVLRDGPFPQAIPEVHAPSIQIHRAHRALDK